MNSYATNALNMTLFLVKEMEAVDIWDTLDAQLAFYSVAVEELLLWGADILLLCPHCTVLELEDLEAIYYSHIDMAMED